MHVNNTIPMYSVCKNNYFINFNQYLYLNNYGIFVEEANEI